MTQTFNEKLDILKNEILELKTFEDKLTIWADFTVNYCDNVARTKIDRCFYAFQSEPKEKPEVLILGLNPRDDYKCDYKGQYENIGWGLNGKMVADVFIHQNPWYKGGKQADEQKEWNILKKMNKTIHVQNELSQLFDNMVYMNILYFASKNFNEFKNSFKENWKEVYENCIQLSTLLITEVIKPKRIICLGIPNCYKQFIGKAHSEEIIKDSLYKCVKNDFKIYGMTHPSAIKSNFYFENIGWYLYADWFNKPFKNSMTNKLLRIRSILSEIAKKYNLKLDFDENKLSSKLGNFKFWPQNENKITLCFEFQYSFYSDLRFGLCNNERFQNKAKKCIKPYDNWMHIDENFNQEDFKNYFENEVKALIL